MTKHTFATGDRQASPFLRKPVPRPQSDWIEASSSGVYQKTHVNKSADSDTLERHLTLPDLVAIGVGGTIGSGLFVLAGLVSHEYAGPATVISWAISGMAALLSGCCYAELSARIPAAGSAYAYTFVALGELPAVLAATCLSLEYIAAAAAVARSWGDKVTLYLMEELGDQHWMHKYLHAGDDDDNGGGNVSLMAFIISTASVVLLLNGVKESKQVTNFFTALKVAVVAFMVIVGLYHVQPTNWVPFIPPQFGVAGVLRGATGTFFGYLGYDQVCCLAGEVKDPKRNLPTAILATLGGVTTLYMLATLALTGMQPYDEISPVSGFSTAFYALDATIAGQITALGEILTLPIVVLITIMAQPRLQYALAEDGLLPRFFRKLDAHGNLWNGTMVSGSVMILVATVVPFENLNDMISCAVLSALSLTDTSLILLWHEAPNSESGLAEGLALGYHVAALLASVAITRYLDTAVGCFVAVVSAAGMLTCCLGMYILCPRSKVFGGRRQHYRGELLQTDDGYFRTPWVPFWPCVGIFINWYLIAQLELVGVVGLLGFLGLAVVYYFAYASRHSVGNTTGWSVLHPPVDSSDRPWSEEDQSLSDESTRLTRSFSLPDLQHP